MASRIAKKPIALPQGVEVQLTAEEVKVKGAKGALAQPILMGVEVTKEGDQLLVKAANDEAESNKMAGTTRALLSNVVIGVSQGFERKLVLIGTGYRAQMQGQKLVLTLGFSHPVEFPVPQGIAIETPSQTEVIVKGVDKQLVGQVAANIRAYRPPEPYKGKGVRYHDEEVVKKETKKK